MQLEEIRELCLSFQSATEDIKWEGDLCFCVAKKMFCATNMHHPLHISFKVTEEQFRNLCGSKHIFPAPYLARASWIIVKNTERFNREEWEQLIRQSYELVVARLSTRTKTDYGITV